MFWGRTGAGYGEVTIVVPGPPGSPCVYCRRECIRECKGDPKQTMNLRETRERLSLLREIDSDINGSGCPTSSEARSDVNGATRGVWLRQRRGAACR